MKRWLRVDSQRGSGSAGRLRPDDPRRVGSYAILGRIGEGGMGAVYLGRAPDGRRVAVKVVKPELARDAGFVARFQDEVANAQRVASFCTAQVLDHGESGGRAFMVTEYIDGVSLLQYVRENGELSPGMLQGVAVGVAAALVAIHSAGLIHRDLKPANVLLSFSGPRVIDFGIARALDAASSHTMTGQLIGSPGWIAPEQILQRPVTTAVDIFAWGCLVAYARNGVNPFGQGDFAVMAARLVQGEPQLGGLPAPLDRLVPAALDKNPRNRPTARDLLLTMVGGESSEAAVLRTLSPSWQPPVPAPPHEETRPADEPVQERHPSAGPPPPHPSPASGPTPVATFYGSGQPYGPDAPGAFPTVGVAGSSAGEAPTMPAGSRMPAPAGPSGRPQFQVGRRVVLAAATAAVLGAGAVTAWTVIGSHDEEKPAKEVAASGPAPLPTDSMVVRVDTAPGWPGKCHGNIGTLTPGAAGAKVLLDAPGKCDVLPQWSPDRRRVAFVRSTGATNSLWVMNADGTGTPVKVTGKLAGRSRVAWSPDGTKIAAMIKVGSVGQIEIITVSDPAYTMQLTTDNANKSGVTWCGNRLAFWSDKNGAHQIYTTDATVAGRPWTQVTKESHDVDDPAWSPDCKKIAYTDKPNGDTMSIWVIGANGTGKRQLDPKATSDMDPTWSPDGKWVAFVRGPIPHPRVWAARADGSGGSQRVSPEGKDIGHADWS